MDRAARFSYGKCRRDIGTPWNDGGDAMHVIGLKALGTIIAVTAALAQPAAAQDKVKVGVFPTASSLPYFVAIERGSFKEQNIEPETIRLIGGPPMSRMVSGSMFCSLKNPRSMATKYGSEEAVGNTPTLTLSCAAAPWPKT